MSKRTIGVCVSFIALFATCVAVAAPEEVQVGATVTLVDRTEADGTDLGIPAHPAAGDAHISARIPSRSTGVVEELGGQAHRNWIRISVSGVSHWIVTKYVASTATAPVAELAYVVGCWNLEHFSNNKVRGFPEYTYDPPGPTLPARNDDQIGQIAQTVADRLGAAFLVLCEINGSTGYDEDGEEIAVSEELDVLLAELPDTWQYIIAYSGTNQRVAFLYDTARVRVNEAVEFEVSPRRIQGKDILERDPFAVHITLLDGEEDRNDLVIVGLHLASGQDKNRNHDAAMDMLLRLLRESQENGELGGASEHDILLMGDLNANMFRPPVEAFFLDMDDPGGDWDVLAGDDYPATRLSGFPLQLRTSQIDYIIASRATLERHGLVGEEITDTTAQVHTELLDWKPPDEFRRDLSDHLPVTIEVLVTEDRD